MAVTTPPVDLPCSAVYSLVKTRNSRMASTPKLTFKPLPGLPLAWSFTIKPSTTNTFPVGRLPEITSATPLPRAAQDLVEAEADCCPIPPTTPACNVANCNQSRLSAPSGNVCPRNDAARGVVHGAEDRPVRRLSAQVLRVRLH